MTEKKNKANQSTPEKDSGQSSGDIDDAVPAKDVLLDNKIDSKEHKKKTKKGKVKKEKQSISKTALFALLLAVFASAGMGYGYFLLLQQQQLTANILSSQNRLEQNLKNTSQALERESRARINSENEFISFKTSIEAVATKLGRTSNEWRLAEVEYLLTIANHRLTLAHDRITAIAIFENADQLIKELSDPALLKIRKLIKEELLLLNAVKEPDLAGMALSLGSLAAKVEDLPLVDKERVAVATGQIKDQAPESWQDIPAAVWKDIKSLVVLKLEQARLALLRGNTVLFRQNLNEANTWLKSFFNEESPAVINALKQTSALSKIELSPAIPDVSGSLRQLRSLLVERGVKLGSK